MAESLTDAITESLKSVTIEDSKSSEKVAEKISPLEAKIIDQVEFYFGDTNLPRDKFLQQQLLCDNGWVPLSIMIKFNKLAKLSRDFDVIATALKKSKSGLIEVHSDNRKIRRAQQLPEISSVNRNKILNRSLYVNGFPTSTGIDDIREFFSSEFVKLDQCVLNKSLRMGTWRFNGSVFAVFPSVEEAEKFLKTENVEFENNILTKKWQREYIEDHKYDKSSHELLPTYLKF